MVRQDAIRVMTISFTASGTRLFTSCTHVPSSWRTTYANKSLKADGQYTGGVPLKQRTITMNTHLADNNKQTLAFGIT